MTNEQIARALMLADVLACGEDGRQTLDEVGDMLRVLVAEIERLRIVVRPPNPPTSPGYYGAEPQWRPEPHTVPQLQAMRELARESPEAQSTVWWVLLCRMVERRCGVSREAQEALGRTESPLVPTPWN